MTSKLYVALPVLNELENLPLLIDCLRKQTFQNFAVVICVNQPDSWWMQENQKYKCINNLHTIEYLQKIEGLQIHIIDRASRGNAWDEKKYGVGWARKTCMDYIAEIALSHDIILSLDADTGFGEKYFESVVNIFSKKPKATALSNPYYHKLTEDSEANRAILRYEIYMRYYLLNMQRIHSPYAFTALGSAMSTPVWAYKKIKGIVPKASGEDFYFLQQLAKVGEIITKNTETVYPAARFSDRVAVGTGPAMIKGRENNWKSYPIFSYHAFDTIQNFYNKLPLLFKENVHCLFSEFLQGLFKTDDLWTALRNNFKSEEKFTKACHEKVDGLRILQFLKHHHLTSNLHSDEHNLIEFIHDYFGEKKLKELNLDAMFNFQTTCIEDLDKIRNFLIIQDFV